MLNSPEAQLGIGQYSERSDRIPAGGFVDVYIEILSKYPESQGKRVLELGAGPGSVMPHLRNKFGEKVFGMEIWERMLRNKKIRAGMLAGEVLPLPVAPNSVDVVVCLHPFEPDDLEDILKELERILTNGGEVTLVIPTPDVKADRLGDHVEKLRRCAGVERLLETWKDKEGEKARVIWNKIQKGWAKEEVQIAKLLEIVEARTVSEPESAKSAWMVTMRKKSVIKIPK
ncbi:MAG: hypothetical protein UW68_C0034G0005 [Candidatus Collierbacteria bacterium GW2011_GWB1_44_6]|uniref:Methyltransferase type 11 domain-containing protein n=2 Tax=Candidatus Collieribacteriota TaxID=1752725 RepID=A0A0G1JLX4_9BACT|nr:MAG: hypothetical protein UV68_C0052G0004 [Candidatus Collierbacteria bacterium GW2011_GWC2_43_12]KKT72536.1 MAG: hypothetical protein UW68_C0034G0005 [Candidatus Collierbacteria bacterium GW2011_GWB1_44_6]